MDTKNILLELRKKQGMSQDEMAEKLFVTRQAVSRWENGETIPNIDTLKLISKIFGISLGNLLGLKDNKLCWFKQDVFDFSYRAAGILIHNSKVLLQKPNNTNEYAFPGGVVIFGETAAEALIRRWHQETGLDIDVGELKWVEENIFVYDGKPCQQICLDYIVNLKSGQEGFLPDGFASLTYSQDDENAVYFYWIPLEEVQDLKVYPEKATELLLRLDDPLKYLSYSEDDAKNYK